MCIWIYTCNTVYVYMDYLDGARIIGMRTIGMRTIGMRIIGMEDNWYAENWHGGQLTLNF